MAGLILKQPVASIFTYSEKDLNEITTLTFAVVNSENANNPITSNGGYGLFMCFNIPFNGSYEKMAIQLLFSWDNIESGHKMYRRIKWNGSWQPWVEV